MHLKNILVYTIIIIQFSSIISINNVNSEKNIPTWNDEWSFREELYIPIETSNDYAKNQPIDILFEFKKPCWVKNSIEHSIRILCWYRSEWYELESQIYDIEETDSSFHIKKCGIVFLIPDYADGDERYFVYYDESRKDKTNYVNHVDVEDSYYYYEPITGISAEGDYYKITEDGFCVFGVGQKGKVIHRKLSQTVIKLKPKTKDFDITKSDNIANFCFSYHKGEEFEDEISSDHSLIAKQILVDGNLMIAFKIISQSEDGGIRTTNTFKYYYCPTDDKRMNIHVEHEVFEDDDVKGIINVDGRYGAIISYQSKSEKIEQMRFGEILPYLHIYREDGKIREYIMNTDPEDKEREWIIPYTDDCDLGDKSWFSYDEGETGKAQAIIFRSNKNIIKQGEDRDGIQMKVAVNEYMDAIGAEIDYAAINFGRNSYEKGGIHDLKIKSGLKVEYDAEFFISENGGYKKVIKEVDNYHKLIEHRKDYDEKEIDEEQKIHTLTVVPRMSGRILSHPILSNITGIKITSVYAELYKNGELIENKPTIKPLFGPPVIKFPKLASGKYLVKVYRDIGRNIRLYIGVDSVIIEEDKRASIICTLPKNIDIKITDQNNEIINGLELFLYKNNTIIDNKTIIDESVIFNCPINILYDYKLIGNYKGFKLINKDISFLDMKIHDEIILHDLIIKIRDKLNFPPGIDLKPYISSSDMNEETRLFPDKKISGNFYFYKIPKGNYKIYTSYGSYSDENDFQINDKNKKIEILFNAELELDIKLLDSNGNNFENEKYNIQIYRLGKKIYDNKINSKILLPPGKYQIRAYSNGKITGFKDIFLTNNKEVKIVTNIKSIIPILIIFLTIIFIVQISIVFILKKISINSFLKIIAMSLILLSIFLPWWSLNAENEVLNVTKSSELYIFPQIMIEKTTINGDIHYDLSTIPDLFTNFLGILFYVVISGFILIGISFIPNILLKKRYSIILIIASFVFLILIASAFIIGMSKLTELSLGSLTGQGALNVTLPTNEQITMNGSWNLGLGFYLCIAAASIAFIDGTYDFIKKKN